MMLTHPGPGLGFSGQNRSHTTTEPLSLIKYRGLRLVNGADSMKDLYMENDIASCFSMAHLNTDMCKVYNLRKTCGLYR